MDEPKYFQTQQTATIYLFSETLTKQNYEEFDAFNVNSAFKEF